MEGMPANFQDGILGGSAPSSRKTAEKRPKPKKAHGARSSATQELTYAWVARADAPQAAGPGFYLKADGHCSPAASDWVAVSQPFREGRVVDQFF